MLEKGINHVIKISNVQIICLGTLLIQLSTGSTKIICKTNCVII